MDTPDKIQPHLWFDREAREAASFYCTLFPDSAIMHTAEIKGTPSGDCELVAFRLSGQSFIAISAGPVFKINPSISFFLNFDPSKDKKAREHLDATWEKLSAGGIALMPLDRYPFSERFGWIQDKYGVSWQLILSNPEGEERPFIVPSLLFTGSVCGKAEEASNFYMTVFNDAKRGTMARYPTGMAPDKEGTIMFTDFALAGQWFAAMDSAHPHQFGFNEALSFMVRCDTQDEIDYYWQKLSAHPESEQCGWCKDPYGVFWQISSRLMDKAMTTGTQRQLDRVTEAFLKMKKIDIATLARAFEGE
jgi:predicted 3-demethylubiquinone-9 3-methyltransferase (glyoxalase superfamily)